METLKHGTSGVFNGSLSLTPKVKHSFTLLYISYVRAENPRSSGLVRHCGIQV